MIHQLKLNHILEVIFHPKILNTINRQNRFHLKLMFIIIPLK